MISHLKKAYNNFDVKFDRYHMQKQRQNFEEMLRRIYDMEYSQIEFDNVSSIVDDLDEDELDDLEINDTLSKTIKIK